MRPIFASLRSYLAADRRLAPLSVVLFGAVYLLSRWWLTPAPPQYLTSKASYETLQSNVLATGTLYAIRQVDVGTRVSGQVKSLHVKLGDHVRTGQLLAELDPVLPESDLRAQQANLANLEAQRKAAIARARRSRLELTRQKGMIGGAVTSRRDVETADAQAQADDAAIAALDAQIAQSRAQLEIAAANLGYTKIAAPIDGEVVAILTQEGQTVVAAQIVPVILKLADLTAMTVKTQVSEADVIHVRVGQSASFSLMGDADTRYAGRLRAVELAPQSFADSATNFGGASSAAQQTSTAGSPTGVFYSALFDVPNMDRRLRIGMTAQVTIELADALRALTVPSIALKRRSGGAGYEAKILTTNGKIETRPVRVGLDNLIRAEILDGVSEGEAIISGNPEPEAVK